MKIRLLEGYGERDVDLAVGPKPHYPEAKILVTLVKLLRPHIVVEVGVLVADTTVAMAWHLPEGGKVYGVDVDIERPRQLIDAWGLWDRIELLGGLSHVVIPTLPDAIDLVYIDGDHDKETVKRDTELIWPKVRSGGIVVWHDINDRGPGEYVPFAFPQGIYIPFGQGLMMAQKPPEAFFYLDGTRIPWPSL